MMKLTIRQLVEGFHFVCNKPCVVNSGLIHLQDRLQTPHSSQWIVLKMMRKYANLFSGRFSDMALCAL